jgi:hypothetical protein
MSHYYLRIRVSSKTPREARKELKEVKYKRPIWWTDIEVLQLKGLKYMPTIIYAASGVPKRPSEFLPSRIGLSLSHFEEVIKVFEELRQKVNVRIVRSWSRADYALWPNDVLSLRKVQDEVNWLAKGDLLSREDSEDRKIAEKLLPHINWYEKEKLTLEEKINKVIESENEWSKDFANYFLKLIDISKRYPSAKFWLYIETPG